MKEGAAQESLVMARISVRMLLLVRDCVSPAITANALLIKSLSKVLPMVCTSVHLMCPHNYNSLAIIL